MSKPRHPVPLEIGRVAPHDVKILWRDGHQGVYPAADLRLACACAACVDEKTGERRVTRETIARDVHPLKISAVGNYAVQILWSDGHSAGLYAFDYLRKICPCPSCRPR